MRIATCVLLYHPKENDLKNILSYLSKVDKLSIYHNTENKGPYIRLNQASKKAIPMVLIF